MRYPPQNLSYRPWAKRLHWIIAALVLTMLLAGQRFQLDLPEPEHLFSLAAHSALGISLLALMVIRAGYRLRNAPPPLPDSLPAWQRKLSALVHLVLYLLLFSVPLLGLVAASASPLPVQPAYLFDLTDLLGAANEQRFVELRQYHELATWALAGLVAFHITAALIHQFVWKDRVLHRMWPARR
ncbi:cytochrome b [Oleomonas cavernae]|uniref:Cytochrome b n=1 Tax=Oleomonas cavernae TaxID=2320859 RepID=A0A418WH45_9PROT|nr:cytochrome b/b6 domain-containing protein [Oleomonas cavernae]RJF89308.1 cytochrome b [Oleomonas cavernae]